jgi:hypothetical protein
MFHSGIVVVLHNSKDVKLHPPPPFQPFPRARFRKSHGLSQSKYNVSSCGVSCISISFRTRRLFFGNPFNLVSSTFVVFLLLLLLHFQFPQLVCWLNSFVIKNVAVNLVKLSISVTNLD